MPFSIVRQDITNMQVDAIVNAANTELRQGGGVCGAIFEAAGAEQLTDACQRLSPIETGQAVITPGFALKARYIIHAAGPIYHRYPPEQSHALLRSAYLSSLALADAHRLSSIAFPLISGGVYGFPKADALHVATDTIREYLDAHDMDVYLAVFDRDTVVISEQLRHEVKQYIDEHYVSLHRHPRGMTEEYFRVEADHTALDEQMPRAATPEAERRERRPEMLRPSPTLPSPVFSKDQELRREIDRLDEPFEHLLLRLIDQKGKTDAEVYKRANIDRKLFSKIRIGNGYVPGKRTILSLAIALELTLEETEDLLARAGYALSSSRKFDVIVRFFITNRRYDIYLINRVLFQYDQQLLGGA